jgi:hypothetical protein
MSVQLTASTRNVNTPESGLVSEMEPPEKWGLHTNPDNTVQGSGQYVLIDDSCKDLKGQPYPSPKKPEKIIGTAVR